MATATRSGDVVTLTLSTEEALYITAELGGGNSYFHGLHDVYDEDGYDSTPFSRLVEALRVGAGRRGPLARRYRQHKLVAEAARPTYDNTEGRRIAEREGFLKPELV